MRKNIQNLEGYSCAQDEYDLKSGQILLLNANENPYSLPSLISFARGNYQNKYPHTDQKKLRQEISKYKKINLKNIICGNGSDEIIDQLIRIFCEPTKDSICICPPTFGMYEVSANLNDIGVVKIPLVQTKNNFELNTKEIINTKAKILFIPNPAAPTGGLFLRKKLLEILDKFKGIVVIDEAYVDFAETESFISEIKNFPNLVILQTFSKFWGLAGARVGMCFADSQIIEKIQTIKMPYSLNENSQNLAIQAIENYDYWKEKAEILVSARKKMEIFLQSQSWVKKIFKSDANFVFFEVETANKIYNFLLKKGIVIRKFGDRRLRVSMGTPDEIAKVIRVLEKINN